MNSLDIYSALSRLSLCNTSSVLLISQSLGDVSTVLSISDYLSERKINHVILNSPFILTLKYLVGLDTLNL